MSPPNDLSTRLALLGLALCTVTTIPAEGFVPGKISTPLARQRLHSALYRPHVFRSTLPKHKPRHLFGVPPETGQQMKEAPKKQIENVSNTIVEDDVMSEAQLELLPEMELSFDGTNVDDTDILSFLDSQQEDIISLPEHVAMTETKTKVATKDQLQSGDRDELKQRNLLEVKLRYDAAARQMKDREIRETDEVEANDDEIEEKDYAELTEARSEVEEEQAIKTSDVVSGVESESLDGLISTAANGMKAKRKSLGQLAESRQRALLEARLMMESKRRANAAAEAKAKADVIAQLKQRSLFEERLKIDSAACKMEAGALTDTEIKVNDEIDAGSDIVVEENFDFECAEMSVRNREKEQESIEVLATSPGSLYILESSDVETPNTDAEIALLEQTIESRQRALLKARIMMEAQLRAKADDEARARAEKIAELKQRSLLEARVGFDSVARQAEAGVLVNRKINDSDEMEAKDDIVIEKGEQESIDIVATMQEPLYVGESSDTEISSKMNEEIAKQEKNAEYRQKALLEARLVMETNVEGKIAAKNGILPSETADSSLEPIVSPGILDNCRIKETEVALEEVGTCDDSADSYFSHNLPLAVPQTESSVISLQGEEGKLLKEKISSFESEEAVNREMITTQKSSKKGTTFSKPKNNFAELLGKSVYDIFGCGAGHFSSCILESGATAFLATKSVFELVTNPEVVETAKRGIMSISVEKDGFAKTNEAFEAIGKTVKSLKKYAVASETCKNTFSCATKATNDFISGCIAMTAFGLKLGGNIRNSYVAAKNAEEEARLKAEREVEEARKVEEERRKIEAEQIEAERRALEIIQKKAEKERRRIKIRLVESEAKALERIRREAEEEENKIERQYEAAIKVLREDGPASFLIDTETYDMQENPQTTETELFFAS